MDFPIAERWMTASASSGWRVTDIWMDLHAPAAIAPSADSSGNRAMSRPTVAARLTAPGRSCPTPSWHKPAKVEVPLPTIGPPSSASARVPRASRACGWATARTRGRAAPSSPKTFPLAGRGYPPRNGRATGAVIQLLPRFAMGYANRPGIWQGSKIGSNG